MTREEAIERIKARFDKWALDDEDMKAIQTLIPELRESEGESIRKALIDALKVSETVGELKFRLPEPTREEAIAYLEKQKELSELGKYIADKRSEVGFYCNHKEVSWNEIPLEDRKHDYPYYFDGNIDCYPFVVRKQEEQNPAVCIPDSTLQKIKRAIMDCKNLSEHYKDTKENFYQYYGGKAEGLQLALAYFRNENEQPLEECVPDSVKFEEGFKTGRELGFREGVESVKPEVWSEEDKDIINEVASILINNENRADDAEEADRLAYLAEKIQSLRPQPHTVSIKDATKFGNLEYERGVKDGIQSEKGRQWKPSEEQMNALDFVLRFNNTEGHKDALQSLHEHLWKLM